MKVMQKGRPKADHTGAANQATPTAERASKNTAAIDRALELSGGNENLRNRKQGPGKPEIFSPAEVIAALNSSSGIKLGAAEKLGCAYNTIQNYIARYPEVREALARI